MYHHTFFPFFSGAFGWLIFIIFLVPYFLPSIVAFSRGKDNAAAVFILNFFLGWTLIGWVVCLVWALSSNKSTTVIVNNTGPSSYPPAYQPAQASAYQQPPQPQPASHQTNITLRPTTAKSAGSQEKIDQLRQLKQLLDDGVLTEEEFNSQKAAILS